MKKNKTKWYYCKYVGQKRNPKDLRFKIHYCKKGYETCKQDDFDRCNDFRYSFYKSFKRFFFLRRLWIEKWYDLYKFRIRWFFYKRG